MTDLAAWLTQIWDEEAADAVKAGGDRWILDGGIHRETHPTHEVVDWVYDEAEDHIARQDPASVLARIAADRQILALHDMANDPCDAHDASFNSIHCDTVRLLALPHADRPGYREEWRP